jgi:hypothetical protein
LSAVVASLHGLRAMARNPPAALLRIDESVGYGAFAPNPPYKPASLYRPTIGKKALTPTRDSV